uniref:BED-type domain-containing protein n=1 Tax=Ananas comosus var. bracteatus TaxID=296719 RepID=A0A6V7PP91_ANACO|nr:unnamed protein product [Ananas comosus var. bracteatus]
MKNIMSMVILRLDKMVRMKDRFWVHAGELNGKFKCKYYSKVYSGGVARLKSHLSQVIGRDIETYDKVPPDVKTKACTTICGYPSKRAKSIGSTHSHSLTFIRDVANYGSGYKIPSYLTL